MLRNDDWLKLPVSQHGLDGLYGIEVLAIRAPLAISEDEEGRGVPDGFRFCFGYVGIGLGIKVDTQQGQ